MNRFRFLVLFPVLGASACIVAVKANVVSSTAGATESSLMQADRDFASERIG